MKTKLVYVLTCAPEASFIEQALMAVWSARYHNPDAHIVIVTDDITDKLLVGKRGDLLKYISEKVVVPFEDKTSTPLYRSRWLKTKVRKLVKGDYLFIDCDTITMCDLSHIEKVNADIAMVRDENIDIPHHNKSTLYYLQKNCEALQVDLSKERYYFNSGVMYVRDVEVTHRLYELWHNYWLEGVSKGSNIDQPAFAKANITLNRPVVLLDDKWNVIIKTQILDINRAYILHFWQSVSFLYSDKVLSYIKRNGLSEFIQYYILHPLETFIPYETHIYHYNIRKYLKFYKCLLRALKEYGKHIDSTFMDFSIQMRSNNLIKWLLKYRFFRLASFIVVIAKMYRVKCSKKFKYYTNYYSKENS